LENDLGLELAALTVLRPGIKTCIEASDDASREMLEHIIVDEEKHVDWIETQLHQMTEVGYQNYLAQQINEKTELRFFAITFPFPNSNDLNGWNDWNNFLSVMLNPCRTTPGKYRPRPAPLRRFSVA
jgi:hypothetical protein